MNTEVLSNTITASDITARLARIEAVLFPEPPPPPPLDVRLQRLMDELEGEVELAVEMACSRLNGVRSECAHRASAATKAINESLDEIEELIHTPLWLRDSRRFLDWYAARIKNMTMGRIAGIDDASLRCPPSSIQQQLGRAMRKPASVRVTHCGGDRES